MKYLKETKSGKWNYKGWTIQKLKPNKYGIVPGENSEIFLEIALHITKSLAEAQQKIDELNNH